MKYVVKKEFLDRFDKFRHCKPGEPHTPPNQERAEQLLTLGYISAVEQSSEKTPASTQNKRSGGGKKRTLKGDGSDGEEITVE